MNLAEVFQNLNWLAIFVAALSNFFIGGIWYTVFKAAWMKANNLSDEDLKNRNMIKIFSLSFIFSLIIALNLAMFIGKADIIAGTIAGFLTGFGWIAFAIGIIALFENKSLKYVLINAGYMVISFTVMGLILGAWK